MILDAATRSRSRDKSVENEIWSLLKNKSYRQRKSKSDRSTFQLRSKRSRSSWRRSLATSRGNESHSRQSLSMPPFRIPTCAGAEKAEAPARGPRKQRRQQRFHSMVSAGVAVIMGKLAKGEAALAAKKQEAKGGAS